MPLGKISRTGDGLVIRIPKEEVDRLNLREGDTVWVDLRKAGDQIELNSEVRKAFERSWESQRENYDDLAEN